MKSSRRWLLALLASRAAGAGFEQARPGYRYQFPRDHFNHPGFRTEWWYYTGNLFTAARRRFGFELTFFRQAVDSARSRPDPGVWDTQDLWLAHFALSDIGGRRFEHWQRLHRAGPGLAGASLERGKVWNGNWHAAPAALAARVDGRSLELALSPTKPPVIHGEEGISRKAAGAGRASHYISLTRIAASGAVVIGVERFDVSGSAWMDHEFFTHQLTPEQSGWDWFSVQLDNGCELMLARIRRRDGSTDPYSHGTWITAGGSVRHLAGRDFRVVPRRAWTSPATRAAYPVHWSVSVPPLGLDLEATTPLDGQELAAASGVMPSYWEGAMDYRGTLAGRAVEGVGYLEMTGYDKPVTL